MSADELESALPSIDRLMSRLRFRQLRLLIALEECGSIHKAAERVAITQPGATRGLNEIEATLGATLFERSARGLAPNSLGRCVVRYARLIETDLVNLREEMAGIQQGTGGRLAVGGVMGAIQPISDTIIALQARFPDASLSVVEGTSDYLLRLLDQGRLDLALCRSYFGRRPDDYHCIESFDEPLSVVANPGHRLVGRPGLCFGELACEAWVVYPVSMPHILEHEFTEAGLTGRGREIKVSSTFSILTLLSRDAGVLGLLPDNIAHSESAAGRISIVDYQLKTRNRPFELIRRLDREPPQLADYFVNRFASFYDRSLAPRVASAGQSKN